MLVAAEAKDLNPVRIAATKMSSPNNAIYRLVIVLGMMVAVFTIIYLTPIPDHNFKSCDRPCHALDWPMICRIKLQIETPDSVQNCKDCHYNFPNCTATHPQVCPAHASPKNRHFTINGRTPGPPIQVCQNDIVVVDVVNKVAGHSLTVHWRGQPTHEAPFMDGVPLVTQCPILSYTTFQYKFRASAPGTHLYHAHSDRDRAHGLFGALVVRRADALNSHRRLYDADDERHVLVVSQAGARLLANGRAREAFAVRAGVRHRFRVAYAEGACAVTVSVDGHRLRVVAVDGGLVGPHDAGRVTIGKGERVDFVLAADQQVGRYAVRLRSSCGAEGMATLEYEGATGEVELGVVSGEFDSAFCEGGSGRVCLGDVEAVERMPERLRSEVVDRVFYLAVGARNDGVKSPRVYGINNLTFLYPPSPLLTQLSETPLSIVCDEVNIPAKCADKEICECVHVEYIPLGSGTEIVLINQDAEEHTFHLHGYRVWLVAAKQFAETPDAGRVKSMDLERRLMTRNLNAPVVKDTVRLPARSAVVMRFVADNAGFWMLRDENSGGWTRGMDMVFQVGDMIDMRSTPSNFPTCGNFIGPDFFLT